MQLHGKSKDNTANTMAKKISMIKTCTSSNNESWVNDLISNSPKHDYKTCCFPLGQFVRSVEVSCTDECLHFHGLWITGLLGPTHKNMVTRIVTKSFLLHPWAPTKHCCFSMQGSQFHMIFAGFTHLAKETNCPLSPVRVPQRLAAVGSAQTWRSCGFSSVFKCVL